MIGVRRRILELKLITYTKDMATLILLNIPLEVSLITLIVDVVATIVVEVVVEVEAMATCDAQLGTDTSTVACYVVIGVVGVALVVAHHTWGIECVV
jgi:hypothetical protein